MQPDEKDVFLDLASEQPPPQNTLERLEQRLTADPDLLDNCRLYLALQEAENFERGELVDLFFHGVSGTSDFTSRECAVELESYLDLDDETIDEFLDRIKDDTNDYV